MRELNTVLGKICRADVKQLCVHEHVFIDMTHEAVMPTGEYERELYIQPVNGQNKAMLKKNPYLVYDNLRLDDAHGALAELRYAAERGVNLLVDVTTVGLGRDVEKLRYISKQSGLHIVAGCGLFVEESLPVEYIGWDTVKIYDWMMKEVMRGIEGTDIRPGIIGEIGTGERVSAVEERSLLAAARVQLQSGLPLTVHTYPWSKAAMQAAELLLAQGVAPEAVCICHVDVSFDEALIIGLLELGVYIEFDDFGKEFTLEKQEGAFAGGPFETDENRVAMIKKLCDKHYHKQILLANDVCLKSLLHRFDGTGYDHIFTAIVPMLRAHGLSGESIDRLIRDNALDYLFGRE